MESEPFHSWLPGSQFHSKTSCWKPLELQLSLRHLKVRPKQCGLSFCLPTTHIQGSRAFLLPTSKGPTQPTHLLGPGAALDRLREWGCQARQRATLSSFLLGIHPMCILSSCSVPGTQGINTLHMAPVSEDSGRVMEHVTTQRNSGSPSLTPSAL